MATKEQWAKCAERREKKIALCCICKQEKPWAEFNPCPSRYPFGLASACKPCDRERKNKSFRKRYWEKSPEERRKWTKKKNIRKFKLSLEDYYKLLEKQNGLCAICEKKETAIYPKNSKTGKELCIDHCHSTGKVRALLCTKCNTGLGMFLEDINIMKKAISYLEKNKTEKEIGSFTCKKCNIENKDICSNAIKTYQALEICPNCEQENGTIS